MEHAELAYHEQESDGEWENSGGRLAYRAHVAMSPNFNSIFSLRDHHAHNNSDWD